jgi:hypothetical protein
LPFLSAFGTKKWQSFMQDGAKAHTAKYSINVLNKKFDDRLMCQRLWHVKSSDQNPCDFYLSGNLRSKVNSNNPHTVDGNNYDYWGKWTKLGSRYFFKKVEVCLRAEGRHSAHLLLWRVLLNNSFTLRNAYPHL